MKNILFPTDFSDAALNAFQYTLEFAKKMNAKITLLHVYRIPIVDANMPGELINQMSKELKEQAEKNLKNLIDNALLKPENADKKELEFDLLVKQGFAVDEVVYAAQHLKADIITMGTTGASGFREIVIGSNTSKVIAKSDIPVLAIPENAVYKHIEKIVYASDFHETDSIALQQLVKIAANFDAGITILHIVESYEIVNKEKIKSLKATIQTQLNYEKINFDFRVYSNLFDGIEEYIQTDKVDWLATLNRKRNMFEKLFNRSFTRKMAFHTKVPLLAFKE
ncbi:MAG: universal stress protein [Chitinophagaceae bacterium]|nr:MAG: universal stress protein [Chitinophagaceae bacterium]